MLLQLEVGRDRHFLPVPDRERRKADRQGSENGVRDVEWGLCVALMCSGCGQSGGQAAADRDGDLRDAGRAALHEREAAQLQGGFVFYPFLTRRLDEAEEQGDSVVRVRDGGDAAVLPAAVRAVPQHDKAVVCVVMSVIAVFVGVGLGLP